MRLSDCCHFIVFEFLLVWSCCASTATAFVLVDKTSLRSAGRGGSEWEGQERSKRKRSRTHPAERAWGLLAKKKKKGGGKKKGGNQKQSGFEWANSFSLKPFESAVTREIASTACASYEGRTGKALCDDLKGSSDIPKALWNAPLACVVIESPSTDEEDDSLLVKYANVAALETVGLKPDQYEQLIASPGPDGTLKRPERGPTICLPSDMKGEKKYESGYKKKIVRGEGEHPDITIENAHRWAIEKSALIEGKFVTETVGVAYAWNSWLEGDGTLCKPGGEREVKIDVEDLEEKIKAQGNFIRTLKEEKGLGNKDLEVTEAVQKLLGMKALLEEVTSAK